MRGGRLRSASDALLQGIHRQMIGQPCLSLASDGRRSGKASWTIMSHCGPQARQSVTLAEHAAAKSDQLDVESSYDD